MKYLSLFSGIGGFELGIEQAYEKKNSRVVNTKRQMDSVSRGQKKEHSAGMGDPHATLTSNGTDESEATCIGYSEIDKYAIEIYEKHFNHKSYGDIRQINPKTLPQFDALVGGFPCQAFSVAGKRKGFSDTRGTLFFEIARIAREKQPRILLLENVKGLLSHDKGNTFHTIINTLDELGYDCQWQVLNSKDFGVPQNRERVFIIGHLRGTPRPEVFPIIGGGEKILKQIGNIDTKGHNSIWGRVYDPKGIASTINAEGGGLGAKTGLYAIRMSGDRGKQKVYKSKEVGALSANPMSDYVPKVAKIAAERGRYNKDGSTSQRLEIRKDHLSNTLTGVEKDNRVIDGKIRRLTPKECERLQGFPDGWTDGISDAQRYKTLGNAVTVNVVRAIAEKLFT